MKNLHKDNIDQIAEELSNSSINYQNVPNVKKGQTVSFSLNDENYIAEMLSRAGKATGKYKNTFNIQNFHPSNKLPSVYVDFDKVKNIQIIGRKNETESVCVIDESCFQNAKQQELENWKSNNAYIEVAKSDKPLLNCRWVCSMKILMISKYPKHTQSC